MIQNIECVTTVGNNRILLRKLAQRMEVASLFLDADVVQNGGISFYDLGTTCTDANGEEDSD